MTTENDAKCCKTDGISNESIIKALQNELQKTKDCLQVSNYYAETLQNRLFYILYNLDKASAEKDFIRLRRLHYDNMEWLHFEELVTEYFEYFHNEYTIETGGQ